MGETKVKHWTCAKPTTGKEEQLCLPSTRRQLVPGYDFQTSTNIGIQPLVAPGYYFEVKPLFSGKDKSVKDYKHAQLHYRTTSSAHDGRKSLTDPFDQANRIVGTKCNFIKEFEEHCKKREVDKMSDPQSKYKTDYKIHNVDQETYGKTVDISPDIHCKIQGVAKNEQPKVDLTSPTVVSILDNYVSTTKADFINISQERSNFFKTRPQKFAVKKEKNVDRIFEEALFRFRFLNRTVLKHVDRVPHGGITTENQSVFKDPWGEIYKKPKPVYDDTLQIRMTKGGAMKVPGMYSSEYSHYGSKISPNEIV